MDFEVKEKTKMNVSIYGKQFVLHKPAMGQIAGFQEKLKDAGEEGSFELMTNFMVGLGLDKETINEMEVEHFTDLVQFVSTSAKKN